MESKDRKKRLEFLLERRKLKECDNYGALFDECVEVLGDGVIVYSDSKSKELYDLFQLQNPFTQWSRIDWSKIKKSIVINDLNEVSDLIQQENIEVYWSYGNFPVLKINFENLLRALDDLTAVSPDTYLYIPQKFVIEIFHEGEITIGYL